jgi:ATP-dependent DNA helicase RecG
VGPRRAEGLSSAGLETVRDLLFYFPRRYLDRSTVTRVADLREGEEATVVGEIRAAGIIKGRKMRFEATLDDGSGLLQLVFFHQPRRFVAALKKGVRLACTGAPQIYYELQMVHPEFEILDSEDAALGPDHGRIVPLYPGSADLAKHRIDSRLLRRLVQTILTTDLPDALEDPLPRRTSEEHGFPPLGEAIRQIHFPDNAAIAEAARRRFAFEELFVIQVHLVQRRARLTERHKLHTYHAPGPPERQLLESLPFELTGDQKKALQEIMADMGCDRPMQRLLQGDVGAGKTVVAAFAMHLAVRSGYQTALMAPTEILAEQHLATLTQLLAPVGIRPELLTGSMAAPERRRVTGALADGSVDLVVGTHALIQESIGFRRLALAVVDEQHRFGVRQRAALAEKSDGTDVLVMTATPIPRTLQLTLYGDLHLTTLRELPPGRTPVTTRLIGEEELPRLWHWLEDRFARGDQAYLVYPIIEESEKQDLKAATAEYTRLKQAVFPQRRLALVHGRTPAEKRRTTMNAFRAGRADLLVATTVIEIGVDIPNANIMVIEHAERFGLSQLHQLRGRIRRGKKRAYCIAVTSSRPSGHTGERLRTFAGTADGFEIAEADLTLRGPGELLGARQHGLPTLRVANLARDGELLERARQDAETLCRENPQLTGPQWRALRRSLAAAASIWRAG